MNNKQKFENFLESLKGNGQDKLVESVKQGFQTCFESGMRELREDELDTATLVLRSLQSEDDPSHADKYKFILGRISSKLMPHTKRWLDSLKNNPEQSEVGTI